MVLAVRWWWRTTSSAAGTSSWAAGVSGIDRPISILTRMKKQRANEHLWLHLIASFRVRAKPSRTRTNASGLDVSHYAAVAQVAASDVRLRQAAT